MQALLTLTAANIKSFVRDRAALFWTLAFPLTFVVLFGLLFGGGGRAEYRFGWIDRDATAQSAQLRDAFGAVNGVTLRDGTEPDALAEMKKGDLRAVVVVPQGYGAAVEVAAGGTPGAPSQLTVYTDPSQGATSGTVMQIVWGVLGVVNLGGRPPAVIAQTQAVQTQSLSAIAYLVPSILGMALMQLGVFSSIPLVEQREKLILKRLNATPLRRWQLVGSNILMRLLIAIAQTLLIVGVGYQVFGVRIIGNPLEIAALVVLGALAFISLGYVIASFASSEDSANAMTSIVQFPMMFLSGTFFAIDQMPDFLRTIARAIPLTYLSDALRQTMVDGTPFSPLWVCFAVLAVWLVACFGIAARYFRWQ